MATITGTAGDDTLTGTSGNDILYGLEGNDTLTGGRGADELYGGNGDDRLNVDASDTVIDGGAGFDTVYVRTSASFALSMAASGVEAVYGGSGADIIDALDSVHGVTISGGAGDDSLYGSGFSDRINGGAGADFIQGGNGDDVLNGGGGGADVLYGGDGDDELYADLDDWIDGGSGYDVVHMRGSIGFSLAMAWSGVEAAYGSDGSDIILANGVTESVTVASGAGDDQIYGSVHDDVLRGDAGDDMIYGNSGNDRISGGGGNDQLTGSGGDDRLYGGAGNDILFSGIGIDTLIGGDGLDTADFSNGPSHGLTLTLRRVVQTDGTRLSSIENLVGTGYDDVLEGDDGDNLLDGGWGGNDLLSGGGGNDRLVLSGAGTLIGGDGVDTADFSSMWSGSLTVNLTTGIAATPSQAIQMSSVENVVGAYYDDTLEGDANDNILTGWMGNDLLIGGDGLDTASYAGNYDRYVITATMDGWTVSDPTPEYWNSEGIDTLTGIEQLQFANRTIFIDGRNNAPIVSGPQRILAPELSGVVAVDLLAGVSDFEGALLSVTDVQQTGGVGTSFTWSGTSFSLDVSQFGDLAPGTALTLTFQSSVTDGDLSSHQDIVIEVRALSFGFMSAMADGGGGSAPLDVTIDTRQSMDALIGGAGNDPLSGGLLLLSGLGSTGMTSALIGGGSLIAA